MPPRNIWTEKEMILALDLYFRLPFGRLNSSTPEVKELAVLIGRTNNSVALRLVNYAACDPYIINSGRKGMPAGKKTCMPYWERFAENREELFYLAAIYRAEYSKQTIEKELHIMPKDFVGKEREAVIKQRVNQKAFHDMIFANYENRCAITGINIPSLLIASHIVPWADNVKERLNPANGICLSALYDKAFDKGLIGIRPDDYSIILSKELMSYNKEDFFKKHFLEIENKNIILPIEHEPQKEFLDYHINNIFAKHN